MSKSSNVKAYPKEFREKVVQLVQGGDRSQREVAEEFGISTDSVRRWVQQAERDQGSRQDWSGSRLAGRPDRTIRSAIRIASGSMARQNQAEGNMSAYT